jgi:HEAT repeat protein
MLLGSCTNVTQMQRKYEAGDESQLDKLLQIAGRPEYPYATRRKATKALGEIGAERAVPVLIGLLYEYDQRSTLKQEALVALGRIGNREAVEPIGRMLDFQLGVNNA